MEINLQVLKPSRARQKAGDVFVFQMKQEAGVYRFGRIIRMDAKVGVFEKCILIYIFTATSTSKDQVPELSRDQLLVPPIATNRQGWLKGYFETVASIPLEPDDILSMHCFRSFARPGRFFNDEGCEILNPQEPIGNYGLDSYRTIDDEISKALGIPLAPD